MIEKLGSSIKANLEQIHHDGESPGVYSIAARGRTSHESKQYAFNCSCRICTGHVRRLQTKEDIFGLKRKLWKDEKNFNAFVSDLTPDGRVKTAERKVSLRQDQQQSELLKKLNKVKTKPKDELVFVERSFNWLMENLLSHNEQILGCEINIPEMVLLEHGKPKYFLKTEEDGCITHVMKNKQ